MGLGLTLRTIDYIRIGGPPNLQRENEHFKVSRDLINYRTNQINDKIPCWSKSTISKSVCLSSTYWNATSVLVSIGMAYSFLYYPWDSQ